MTDTPLKPNRKHQHLYAILRCETDADVATPIDLRITVTKVVVDANHAEAEVKRLNELNQEKGCYYFSQVTRLDEALVDTESLAHADWEAYEVSAKVAG